MHNRKEERKRLVWISLFVFFLFCLLIVQFFKIQIIEGDKWTKIAQSQHQLVVVEPFKRGLFYSNTALKQGHPDQMQPFVIDVPKFHLYADPLSLPEKCHEEIAKGLKKYLSAQEQEKLKGQLRKKSRSRKLALWLDHQQRSEIQKWWDGFARKNKIARNALFFVQDYQRSYPFGKLLGQVLHTVREEKNQVIPTGGLELIFNEVLSGKPGKRLLLRSPRHPLDTDKILAQPEDGADVYLTVNHYLQAIAEEEIAKAVEQAHAKGGWAIMMEPHTGEIWALAQYPGFNPAAFPAYFNDPKKLEDTKVKAVTDPYEPGSTFKTITIAVALKANAELKKRGKKPLFSPSEKIATSNGHFPGRSSPIRDTHHHAFLNLSLGFQKSSNIYMARLIQRVVQELGEEWYRSTLHDLFGFGKKTGIELPSETVGLLPTPGKKHPSGALEWSTPTPFSLAFGHNILVNSFQMLRSYALIVNGGFAVQPTLVRKIVKTKRDGTQEILVDHTQNAAQIRVLEPEICEQLIDLLKLVTKPGGSASKGDIPGYTEGGKTGTSEKIIHGSYSKNIHFSSFIGFAPAKNPRFVLMIAIDEPEAKFIPGIGKNQMGGNCAAPAFRAIGLRTLQYLGVEPDDPNNTDLAPLVSDLKKLYSDWNHR